MKKYIFAFLLFLLAIIGIDNVFAVSYNGWAYDKIHPVEAYVTDCSASNCNVTLNADASSIDSSNYFFYQGTRTSMSANGEGILWAYMLNNTLKSGYLYSIASYFCHNSTANFVLKNSYVGNSYNDTNAKSYPVTSYYQAAFSNLDTMPFNTSSIGYSKCGVTYSIFKPNKDSSVYGVNFTLSANASNYSSAFVGYEIQTLGIATNLTSSDIQNIISGSGLATASDISSVNSSINNIQSSISSAESNIINNQNQNRQAIIDNQNENTNKEIESQKVCKDYDSTSVVTGGFLTGNGSIYLPNSSVYGVTDYINISNGTIELLSNMTNPTVYYCFYNVNKSLISCTGSESSGSVTIPENSIYFRGSIYKTSNRPTYRICLNGNQALDNSINNVNDTLNNSDSSGATSDAGSFFSGFTTNTFGLTSIITSPLNLINSLTSKTCSPLTLQIPFVNQTMQLPCMSTIYQQHFGSFLTVYQTITFGIISYWVCIRIFALVKDFKNPDHDEIEVMDL